MDKLPILLQLYFRGWRLQYCIIKIKIKRKQVIYLHKATWSDNQRKKKKEEKYNKKSIPLIFQSIGVLPPTPITLAISVPWVWQSRVEMYSAPYKRL